MGKKFLAVFLILISILSFSSCSMDSLTDFMGKMGVNIVPYDDTKAKKAAEETNLSSSDVDKNATVTEGKVSIGGVEISLEEDFDFDGEGGMLKPLKDNERKEVVNTLYNAVVTLNPKDKETVVAEKAKPAPKDVQTATKNTAAVLESALNKLKETVSGEAEVGEINKVQEVMGSLASSLNTIASNKTVSQGEALAVQLMQSFVATASKAYTGESVTNDDYINLANEAYNIAVIASAITPTLNIGLEDLIGAVVSEMGSSSSSEEEVTYSSRSLMLLSAEGEKIPNHSSKDEKGPSVEDFENIGIPEESALVLRNYYKAISPFLNDPDYMNTIAVYKASFDNYMVFAEKAGEAYMASDEFKSIAEPSIFFNYALTSALYELENQYKLIRKEAEIGGQLDAYIELEGTVQVDGEKYNYKFPETIVDLINDFADSNSWVKDDSKLVTVEMTIGESCEYVNGVGTCKPIKEDLVKIEMPKSIKGIVFAFAYDSDFSGDKGEENTESVIDVINGIVVDNNASLLAALNSAEIALTHGDLLSSIIDLVTQMAGEDTGDVETPTDTEIEKALDEARAFLKSKRWVEDYFNRGETV